MGAVEKSTGKEFIYFNHVVKFPDVAMRGAWTSGGIEFNFGIFGHTPSCSSPVDYLTRENADGSTSCFVGVQIYHLELAGVLKSTYQRTKHISLPARFGIIPPALNNPIIVEPMPG